MHGHRVSYTTWLAEACRYTAVKAVYHQTRRFDNTRKLTRESRTVRARWNVTRMEQRPQHPHHIRHYVLCLQSYAFYVMPAREATCRTARLLRPASGSQCQPCTRSRTVFRAHLSRGADVLCRHRLFITPFPVLMYLWMCRCHSMAIEEVTARTATQSERRDVIIGGVTSSYNCVVADGRDG